MRSAMVRLSTSNRRKLTSILLAVAIFASLSMLTASVLGRPVINGLLSAINGNTINIAARMEEAAKVHGVACIISGDVANALLGSPARLVPIGYERVRGIATEIPIFEYRVARDAAPSAEKSARQPMALLQRS